MTLAIVIELMQRAPVVATEGTWPTTVSGWFALVGSILSLLIVVFGGAIAYGRVLGKQEAVEKRMEERLNGFGERVGKAEASIERINGAEIERVRQLDRVEVQHETVLAAVGESKGIAARCQDDAMQESLKLGSLVAAVDKRVTDFELSISNRMTRVETKAKINPKEFDDDA